MGFLQPNRHSIFSAIFETVREFITRELSIILAFRAFGRSTYILKKEAS